MATEAVKNKEMARTFTSLSFRSGKNSPDNDLITAANEFASLEENQGIAPTALLRNYITRKLKEAIDLAKNKNETLRTAG